MAKIYPLKAGTSLTDEIARIAAKERIKTGMVAGIGTVNKVRLAYFNHQTKKYEEHEVEEQLEVTGVLGNITQKDGKPFVHLHGTFGRRDTSVMGGHITSATVFPLMEIVVTPTSNQAYRTFDEEIGLNVISKTSG